MDERANSTCVPHPQYLRTHKVNHQEHLLQLALERTIKDLPESITHSVRQFDQTNTTGTLLNSIQSLISGNNFKAQLLQYQEAQKEEFGAGFQRTCLKENSNSKVQRMAELKFHAKRLRNFTELG